MPVKKASPKTTTKKTPAHMTVPSFSTRNVHARPVSPTSNPAIGSRDMLLLTILSTAFLAIIFAGFANDYGIAMYAMTAITIVASIAMILVVLLSRE